MKSLELELPIKILIEGSERFSERLELFFYFKMDELDNLQHLWRDNLVDWSGPCVPAELKVVTIVLLTLHHCWQLDINVVKLENPLVIDYAIFCDKVQCKLKKLLRVWHIRILNVLQEHLSRHFTDSFRICLQEYLLEVLYRTGLNVVLLDDIDHMLSLSDDILLVKNWVRETSKEFIHLVFRQMQVHLTVRNGNVSW